MTSLAVLQGCQALLHLDVRNNGLQRLQDLAPLQACSSLRELLLSSRSPGQALCQAAGYRTNVASMLPQLQLMDGQLLAPDRLQHPAAAHQHSSSQAQQQLIVAPAAQPTMLQLVQPKTPLIDVALDEYRRRLAGAAAVGPAAGPFSYPYPAQLQQQQQDSQHLQGVHPADAAAAASGQGLQDASAPSGAAASQEQRIAALEAQLQRRGTHATARAPLAVMQNPSRDSGACSSVDRAAAAASAAALRKLRQRAVSHEAATQTSTDMLQLDRLHRQACPYLHSIAHTFCILAAAHCLSASPPYLAAPRHICFHIVDGYVMTLPLPDLPAWSLHHTAGASGGLPEQPHTHMQLHPALSSIDRSALLPVQVAPPPSTLRAPKVAPSAPGMHQHNSTPLPAVMLSTCVRSWSLWHRSCSSGHRRWLRSSARLMRL